MKNLSYEKGRLDAIEARHDISCPRGRHEVRRKKGKPFCRRGSSYAINTGRLIGAGGTILAGGLLGAVVGGKPESYPKTRPSSGRKRSPGSTITVEAKPVTKTQEAIKGRSSSAPASAITKVVSAPKRSTQVPQNRGNAAKLVGRSSSQEVSKSIPKKKKRIPVNTKEVEQRIREIESNLSAPKINQLTGVSTRELERKFIGPELRDKLKKLGKKAKKRAEQDIEIAKKRIQAKLKKEQERAIAKGQQAASEAERIIKKEIKKRTGRN